MSVCKQSGVGFPNLGSYLVFNIMNYFLWICSKSLMLYSIQFINNYKFILQPLPGPAFLFFFLSPTPILLFSSISLHWSLRKGFLPLLAILWNSAFIWVYLSFSPVLFAYLLSTAIYEALLSHFDFLHFFFLRMVLLPASCEVSWTSVHSSSGTLSVRSSPLNVFLTSTV